MRYVYPLRSKNVWTPWRRPRGAARVTYAREAILLHLEDLEDIYLAEQRLIDHREGRGETVSMEEMRQRVGLED